MKLIPLKTKGFSSIPRRNAPRPGPAQRRPPSAGAWAGAPAQSFLGQRPAAALARAVASCGPSLHAVRCAWHRRQPKKTLGILVLSQHPADAAWELGRPAWVSRASTADGVLRIRRGVGVTRPLQLYPSCGHHCATLPSTQEATDNHWNNNAF